MNHQNQLQRRQLHLREYVALSLVPKLGAQRIRLLLDITGNPQQIFRMTRKELKSIDGIGPAIANSILKFNDWDQVDRIIEQTGRMEACIITQGDKIYPKLLKEIYDPPALFWLKGDPNVLDMQGLAVIGTRRATSYGIKMAERYSSELVRCGLAVVSGLAYGVDAAAHKATIKAGGKTIAVLGSGIDTIYPRKHIRLARDIIETGGAVISEFPLGTAPDAGNFPVRNRVVSGMTLGTLVIESGLEGGSMITARSALDQNREVFVVPHSLENNNGTGCNAIIKQGWGKLVQSAEDIVNELPVQPVQTQDIAANREAKWKSQELDELALSICRRLEERSRHIDDLSQELGLASHKLLPKLLELEIKECVRQTAGKNFELQ